MSAESAWSVARREDSGRSWARPERAPEQESFEDRPAGDRPAGDRQAGDRPAEDRPVGDRPAHSDPTADQGASTPVREIEAERIIARLRPHGRAMFWPSLVLIASVGAIAYLLGRFDLPWQNQAVPVVGAVVIVLFWLIPLLSFLSKRYVITTRRIVIRRGLLSRTRQELLHSRGHDVTVRRNLLQSVVRSGDVLVNTGLDRPVVLRDVPSADLVQGSLHDLMESSVNPIAARRQAEQSGPAPEHPRRNRRRWRGGR